MNIDQVPAGKELRKVNCLLHLGQTTIVAADVDGRPEAFSSMHLREGRATRDVLGHQGTVAIGSLRGMIPSHGVLSSTGGAGNCGSLAGHGVSGEKIPLLLVSAGDTGSENEKHKAK